MVGGAAAAGHFFEPGCRLTHLRFGSGGCAETATAGASIGGVGTAQ